MQLAEFLATPSGRAICDASGRKTVQFSGMADAEAAKRILLSAVHLRPLLVEFEASRAGRSPISTELLLPAISAACAYLGRCPSTEIRLALDRAWTCDGDVIRRGEDVIAVVMSDAPPELADLVKEAPQACASALQLLELAEASTAG